jgi:DNA-binding CsgD family transcriptional regulator
VLNAQRVVDPADDQGSIVSRRRTPQLYVMDATGDVLLRGTAKSSLSVESRATMLNLVAKHPGDDVVLALSPSGEMLRMVRLRGDGGPCFALFIETFATRSPIDAACGRYALSDREREVLPYLLRGASTTKIAEDLIIAESTVATHVRNIGAKMNASKRKEIVATVLGGR